MEAVPLTISPIGESPVLDGIELGETMSQFVRDPQLDSRRTLLDDAVQVRRTPPEVLNGTSRTIKSEATRTREERQRLRKEIDEAKAKAAERISELDLDMD